VQTDPTRPAVPESGTRAGRHASTGEPVFVDATGRRRRRIRTAGLIVLAAAGAYLVTLGLAFLGGPVPPAALLPINGVSGRQHGSNPPVVVGTAGPIPNSSQHSATGGSSRAPGVGGAGSPHTSPPPAGGSVSPSATPSAASASPSASRRPTPPGHVGKSGTANPGHGH
jgi:hypothetical protein